MSFRLKHKKSSSETFGLKNPLLSTLKIRRPSLETLKDRKLSTGGNADIEVVVGIDFGATFSGFAYSSLRNPEEIETNTDWPETKGLFKTPTALQYDSSYTPIYWGQPALTNNTRRRRKTEVDSQKPVELFKLHLSAVGDDDKPALPRGLGFEKVITDYLAELGKLMKSTLASHWPHLDYQTQVLKVLSIPAEYGASQLAIMRSCAYKAGLIDSTNSDMLEFISEPESAAIYCMKNIEQHGLKVGDLFTIADCGGGTTDLTTRRLLSNSCLSEVTLQCGALCGSSYIDIEFHSFLARKLGYRAVQRLRENHYGALQYLTQQFFIQKIKIPFKGVRSEFRPIDLDLEELCPEVKQYVTGIERDLMEQDDWLIDVEFDTVKEMFDKVIEQILELIEGQLNMAPKEVKAIFLVGGFGENYYLLRRVREKFEEKVKLIATPLQPSAAVVRGNVHYGLRTHMILTRVLKHTYGVEISRKAKKSDPSDRILPDGSVHVFHKLAERGMEVRVDQEFTYEAAPVCEVQEKMKFDVFRTTENNANYCDELGMKKVGGLVIDLPDLHLGLKRIVRFSLTFGGTEIHASAKNKKTGQVYHAKFDVEI